MNNTDTSLRAWLRNTGITLHARLSRSRLLWPIQYLPIYMFFLFYTGTSRLPPRALASGPRPIGTMIIVVALFALPHNSLRTGQASWTSSWRIFQQLCFRSNEEISCQFTSYLATRISLPTFVHHCIPEELSVYGRIDDFKPEIESCTQYEERLSQCFLANDIEDAKQRELFYSA